MSSAHGSGLGKLILCGEHAVVHGHPALAFAVDRHTEVVLTRRPGPRTVAPQVDDPRLPAALDLVLPAEGIAVQVHSDLPVGRGMGSSAALAVALVRARAALDEAVVSPKEIFERALAVERVFHGNPSGLDVAVAVHGGFLAYRRGPPVVLDPLDVAVPWSVVVLDTERSGDTAALVASVARRGASAQPALKRIGDLVVQARTMLADPRALGELLNENQSLLVSIGVSSPEIEELVDLARRAGAHGAKLSGAGGGGVVIALVTDPDPVLRSAAESGVAAFACRVGAFA